MGWESKFMETDNDCKSTREGIGISSDNLRFKGIVYSTTYSTRMYCYGCWVILREIDDNCG